MEDKQALLLVDAQSDGVLSLIEGMLSAIGRLLGSLPEDAWSDDRAKSALAQLAGLSRTAQEASAGLTWNYLDAMGNHAQGHLKYPSKPRGVDPTRVWARPLKTYNYERSLGVEHDAAVERALARAEHIARDDIRLATRTASAQHSLATPGVTGQRRVIHPELAKGGTCGLCIAASDRIYHPGKLLPIHDGCNCTVAEITAKADPGSSLNNLSLKDLYKEAGGTSAADLKRTRYQVNEHGELGPVLYPAKAKVRTKKDVERDTGRNKPDAEKAKKQLAVIEESIAALEQRAAAGEDVSTPLAYQKSLRERLLKRAA